MRIISDDFLHFVGDWSTAERRRIRRAVSTFERAWVQSNRSQAVDDPEWVVVQESPSWGAYYFAHRLGTRDSLTGRTAAELAATIETSSREL
ncbi:MAG TPA: hypothetical protein VJ884_06470 [Salinibacter sp.]|nr:hypothetical protein [Salinibacter sp.]